MLRELVSLGLGDLFTSASKQPIDSVPGFLTKALEFILGQQTTSFLGSEFSQCS